jgi:hypothetical protein
MRGVNRLRMARVTAVGVVALALGGCASHEFTKPAPHQTQAIVVKYTSDDLSGWTDLPIGTYRVPNSQVIISGHQKGGGIGVLFGPVGVAVEHAAGSGAGKAAVKTSEDALHITLTSEAQEDVATLLGSAAFAGKFTLAPDPAAPVLSISGGVALTFVNDTDARPYVVLRTKLLGPKATGASWTTRYMASVGPPRALAGDDSWTSDGGAALKAAVSAELIRALQVMLTDVSTPFARDDGSKTLVESYFPFARRRYQVVGYTLTEDSDSISFVPKISDGMVFAGVNIMDKSVTTSRAATKDDRTLRHVDPPKP